MELQKFSVGQEVVRSKGEYVVGRLGVILSIENEKAKVNWQGCKISQVAISAIEPVAIPYEIIPAAEIKDKFGFYKFVNPKYIKL